MAIKQLLLLLLLSPLLIALGGCGYTLRGSSSIPLDIPAIVLETSQANQDIPRLLRRRLERSGVEVLQSGDSNSPAPRLQLGDEMQESRPISVSTRASAAQYEILMSVDMTLFPANGGPPFSRSLRVERRHTETIELIAGSQEEARIILSEMRGELVEQILRTLEANL